MSSKNTCEFPTGYSHICFGLTRLAKLVTVSHPLERSGRFFKRLKGSFHAAFLKPPCQAVREMASKCAVKVAKRPRPWAKTPMPMTSSEGPVFSWKHWTSWASQNKGAAAASCQAGTAKDKQTRSWRRRQDILGVWQGRTSTECTHTERCAYILVYSLKSALKNIKNLTVSAVLELYYEHTPFGTIPAVLIPEILAIDIFISNAEWQVNHYSQRPACQVRHLLQGKLAQGFIRTARFGLACWLLRLLVLSRKLSQLPAVNHFPKDTWARAHLCNNDCNTI